MKKKQMIYVLGPFVAIVWGVILYRVFSAVKNDDLVDITYQQPTIIRSKEKFNDYAVIADTTHLSLKYKNPFSAAKIDTNLSNFNRAHSVRKHTTTMLPVFDWGFLTYSGYIRNPRSGKLLAMVKISGKEYTLKEGETQANVELLKNMRDSIKVRSNGRTKFIAINTSDM